MDLRDHMERLQHAQTYIYGYFMFIRGSHTFGFYILLFFFCFCMKLNNNYRHNIGNRFIKRLYSYIYIYLGTFN